jgi:hypothetical protein
MKPRFMDFFSPFPHFPLVYNLTIGNSSTTLSKCKAKLKSHHESLCVSDGITEIILNIRIWLVRFTFSPLYHQVNRPMTHRVDGWMWHSWSRGSWRRYSSFLSASNQTTVHRSSPPNAHCTDWHVPVPTLSFCNKGQFISKNKYA